MDMQQVLLDGIRNLEMKVDRLSDGQARIETRVEGLFDTGSPVSVTSLHARVGTLEKFKVKILAYGTAASAAFAVLLKAGEHILRYWDHK